MRLRIKEISFSTDENWIFKLSDGLSDYYVLNQKGYKSIGLKSPISKNELDYWDIGHSVVCETNEVNNMKIVTKVK